MNMKTLRKILMLVCMMAMVVCISVGATLAYLTDDEAVVNTFTVGQVGISLDEAKVNTDGTVVTGADRVQENEYHLLPGHTYTKDPTVHVDADSESCWLFVKVENGIADIEATSVKDGYQSIADQIVSKYGWTKLTGVDNVYYKEYTKATGANRDFVVFDQFMIDGEKGNDDIAGFVTEKGEDGKPVADAVTVSVTAYAIQKDGFDDAVEAWKAGKFE